MALIRIGFLLWVVDSLLVNFILVIAKVESQKLFVICENVHSSHFPTCVIYKDEIDPMHSMLCMLVLWFPVTIGTFPMSITQHINYVVIFRKTAIMVSVQLCLGLKFIISKRFLFYYKKNFGINNQALPL